MQITCKNIGHGLNVLLRRPWADFTAAVTRVRRIAAPERRRTRPRRVGLTDRAFGVEGEKGGRRETFKRIFHRVRRRAGARQSAREGHVRGSSISVRVTVTPPPPSSSTVLVARPSPIVVVSRPRRLLYSSSSQPFLVFDIKYTGIVINIYLIFFVTRRQREK